MNLHNQIIELVLTNSWQFTKCTVFLHAPKTGGTSVKRAFGANRDYQIIRIPAKDNSLEVCDCLNSSCERTINIEKVQEQFGKNKSKNLFLDLGHSDINTMKSVSSLIKQNSKLQTTQLITFRNGRERLLSMVTDYLTQANEYKKLVQKENQVSYSLHDRTVWERYYKDSQHYFVDGKFNLELWLTAFATHGIGAGLKYFMSEIIPNDSKNRKFLRNNECKLIKTKDLNQYLLRHMIVSSPDNLMKSRVSTYEAKSMISDQVRHLDWKVKELVKRDQKITNYLSLLSKLKGV